MNTRLPSEAFVWPCRKRIAHGAHWVDREVMFICKCFGTPTDLMAHDADCPAAGQMLCPGVKAHPNTMIGRETLPVRRKPLTNFPPVV